MRRFAGACRFVFNKALALQQSNHADGGKYIGYVEMAKRLTAWRNSQETPWLKDAPAHPLQHALKDLDRAYLLQSKRRRVLFIHEWPDGHGLRDAKSFATFSDGSFLAPLNSFRQHEQRLARYQRRMARKVKGSKNWNKAKKKVQRVHAEIANVRKDFLHKATTAISQQYALVVLEDLKVRNMSKSAKGNAESPGKKVRAKSGLNKSILDQGWYEFRRQLEYKMQWQGGWLMTVNPRNTSRTCPVCAMCQLTIAPRKPNSPVCPADTKPTRMSWAPSTSSLAGCKTCDTEGRTCPRMPVSNRSSLRMAKRWRRRRALTISCALRGTRRRVKGSHYVGTVIRRTEETLAMPSSQG